MLCYLAVVHPVIFLKFKPLRYRVICCTAVWILTLGSCFCCMFTMVLFYNYVCFFFLQFFLFLSIQLFCFVAVLRALKLSGPGEREREKWGKLHKEKSISSHSYNFCKLVYYLCAIYYLRILFNFDTALY